MQITNIIDGDIVDYYDNIDKLLDKTDNFTDPYVILTRVSNSRYPAAIYYRSDGSVVVHSLEIHSSFSSMSTVNAFGVFPAFYIA